MPPHGTRYRRQRPAARRHARGTRRSDAQPGHLASKKWTPDVRGAQDRIPVLRNRFVQRWAALRSKGSKEEEVDCASRRAEENQAAQCRSKSALPLAGSATSSRPRPTAVRIPASSILVEWISAIWATSRHGEFLLRRSWKKPTKVELAFGSF